MRTVPSAAPAPRSHAATATTIVSGPGSAPACAIAARRVHSGSPADVGAPVSQRPSAASLSAASPIEFTTIGARAGASAGAACANATVRPVRAIAAASSRRAFTRAPAP
jgi:hypothetical protein